MSSAVVFALLAALCFGWSTAAMHADAFGAPDHVTGHLALLRHVFSRWRWLTGFTASWLGLVLHALALSHGSLAVVQPLVVTGLVFGLGFRAALDRMWPSRQMVLWSGVTVAGLAVFLAAAGSTKGRSTPTTTGAVVMLGVGAIVACVCWRTGSTERPRTRGLCLGAGTGVIFGLIAGTLKAVSGAHSLGGALTSWPIYVLTVLGMVGFIANQTTYRSAPLATSLPILNVTNPIVALAFGLIAFDERPATDLLSGLVEIVSFLAILAGVFFLARQDPAVRGESPHCRPPQNEKRVLVGASR